MHDSMQGGPCGGLFGVCTALLQDVACACLSNGGKLMH
jgi:hypothetical protein